MGAAHAPEATAPAQGLLRRKSREGRKEELLSLLLQHVSMATWPGTCEEHGEATQKVQKAISNLQSIFKARKELAKCVFSSCVLCCHPGYSNIILMQHTDKVHCRKFQNKKSNSVKQGK